MAAVGTVAAFDEHKGLGTVRADDGRELPFHCTSILDGSRTIEAGVRVSFSVVAGHRGQWEAADLVEVGNRAVARGEPTSLSGGVSAGLAGEARRDEKLAELRAAVVDYESEFGEITPEEMEQYRRTER